MKTPLEEIDGEFDRIVWAADDNSFLIARLKNGLSIVGSCDPSTFVRGMEYRFSGRWEEHRQYGQQFRFQTVIAKEPVTAQAVTAYLRKFLYDTGCGIGAVKGNKLIAELGAKNCIAVIKAQPERVAEITGVTIENAKNAAKQLIAVEKFENTRMQLVALLEGRGFSQKCIEMAIQDFGVVAAERIRRDPFTLLVRKYPSAGFLRCDQLYRDLGLPEFRLKRQVICLWHLINQASGSVWIDADFAVGELRRLISSHADPKRAIVLGTRAKWLSTKRDKSKKLWIAERQDANNEFSITETLKELQRAEVHTLCHAG
jgi:exodeoxyribonuclease V alpha subunit